MSNTSPDLDFLDDVNPNTAEDPAENNAPLYKRKIDGFYADSVTFAEGGLKKNGKWTFIEIGFIGTPNAAGDDAVMLSFSYPAAAKPCAITLKRLGVSNDAIRKALKKPTDKAVAAALNEISDDIYVVQIPNAVKGRGGKRYPKQNVYNSTAWETLCAAYGGNPPTADDLGVTESASSTDAVDDDDDAY